MVALAHTHVPSLDTVQSLQHNTDSRVVKRVKFSVIVIEVFSTLTARQEKV